MATTTELRDRFATLQRESVGWFESAKNAGGDWTKVDGLDGDEQARFEQVEQRGKELDDLREQIVEIEKREASWQEMEQRAALALPEPPRPKSPIPSSPGLSRSSMDEHLETRGFMRSMMQDRDFLNGRATVKPLEFRALFGTGRVTGAPAGYPPQTIRTGEVIDVPLGPQDPFDMIPQYPTNQQVIAYMEQTTQTRAAAMILEGGTYPEAAFIYTQRTVPVSKIGAVLPVTDESMDNPEFSSSEIESDLVDAVRRNATALITTGTVAANHWTGLAGYVAGADRARPTSSQVCLVNRGPDTRTDTLLSALTSIIDFGESVADGVLIHPRDWEEMRSERGPDGNYINGVPSSYMGANPWGLGMMFSSDLPRGTVYVGAWSSRARIHPRNEMEVKMTDSHSTDFTTGRMMFRASVRFAFYLIRPSAFARVDLNA